MSSIFALIFGLLHGGSLKGPQPAVNALQAPVAPLSSRASTPRSQWTPWRSARLDITGPALPAVGGESPIVDERAQSLDPAQTDLTVMALRRHAQLDQASVPGLRPLPVSIEPAICSEFEVLHVVPSTVPEVRPAVAAAPFATELPVENRTNVTLSLASTPAESVVSIISKQTGINIVLLSKADQRVTLNLTEMPLIDALRHLATLLGCRMLKVNGAIVIAEEETLKSAYQKEYEKAHPSPPSAETPAGATRGPDKPVVKSISRVVTLSHYSAEQIVTALRDAAENLDLKVTALPAALTATLDQQNGGAVTQSSLNATPANTLERVSKKLLVTGTPQAISSFQDLISQLDVSPEQVEITVSIYDVNDENIKDAGLTWTPGGFSVTETPSQGFSFGTFSRTGLSFQSVMQALETQRRAKLLASPNVTVVDANRSSILVGERRQLPVVSGTGANGQFIFSVQEIRVGIYLQVAANVGKDGTISLTVKPEVSTITGFIDVNGGKYPQIATRESSSSLNIREGDTVVLGGLLRDEEIREMTSTPLLSNIPVLGELFKSRRTERRRSQLVISITPRIIRP